MKKNILKKILSILFAISLCVQLTSFGFAHNIEHNITKMTPELQAIIASTTSDEKIPILIDIKQISEKAIRENMIKAGWDYDVFYDENLFAEKMIPQIQSLATDKLEPSTNNISTTVSLENQNDFQEAMLDIEYQVRKDFKIARQDTIKVLQTSFNEKFIQQNQIPSEDIIYISQYVSYIILNANISTINKLNRNSNVRKISYLDPENGPKPAMSISSSSNQAKMNMLNSSYDCSGITIGILETIDTENLSGNAYRSGLDTSSPHITYQTKIYQFYNALDNSSNRIGPSSHTTAIASIIAGAPVTINGTTYRGVTQNATVYVAVCNGLNTTVGYNFLSQLELLIQAHSDVINISMGWSTQNTYQSIQDEIIDKYSILGTLFVIAAGNNDKAPSSRIISPAHSYNSIAVANASLIGTTSSYTINNTSCYNQDVAPYQTNKPDIAAAGTSIQVPTSNTTISSNTGTSFAAPFVTGAAARIIKLMPETLQNPTLVKTILLASANSAKISGDTYCTSDRTSTGTPLALKQKSGAGLLDLDKAVEILSNNQYSSQKVEITQPTEYTNIATFTPGNGHHAKVTLCFNIIGTAWRKLDQTTWTFPDPFYNLNIDLRVINNRTGQVIASSESLYNNVEIVEFDTTSDSYTIQYKVTTYDLEEDQDFLIEYRHTISCAWQWR